MKNLGRNKWLWITLAGVVVLFVIVLLLKLWVYILFTLVGVVIGFLLGRKSTQFFRVKDPYLDPNSNKRDRQGFL